MTGFVRPQPGGAAAAAAAAASGLNHGKMGSLLIGKVMDLLSLYIQSGEPSNAPMLADLCHSLYRGIDYALMTDEIPIRSQELPILLKQVCCTITNDVFLRTAVMLLMISVKNACRSGWFPDQDMADLLTLAKEVAIPFGNEEDIRIEPSNALPYVSKIMSRFYPQIKMGNIHASLMVKPGYSAFWVDFQILKSMMATGQEKIGLFVAQTDDMDTSSCLVTPSEVNFLLNGYGVMGRTVGNFMDKRPQLPTDVTPMLKYGINLIQAIGQFNGNYLIIIASASMTSTSDTSVLQDYIQPALASVDSDFEIIEGPSRISLNCPISHKRIRNPVKGHLCKHYQCFEYDNYIKLNTKRPAWRCPLCNRSVCYPDLRIDRNMVKILEDVGENVDYVMIYADGSWKAVLENEDPSDKTKRGKGSSEPEMPESARSSSMAADVIDITKEGASGSDSRSISESANGKHYPDNHPGHAGPELDTTDDLVQNSCAQREESISLSISSSQNVSTICASSCAHTTAASSELLPTSLPILTDAVSPVANQEHGDIYGRIQMSYPSWRNQISNTNVLQQFRTPFASQTLLGAHAQDPSSSEQRISNSLMPSVPTDQSTSAVTLNGGTAMGQLHPWSFASSFPVSNMASSSMQHQGWAANDFWNLYGQSVQQVHGCTPQALGTQLLPGYSYLHQSNTLPSQRNVSAMMHSQTMAHPYTPVQSVQVQPRYGGSLGTSVVNNRQHLPRAIAQSSLPMSRSPSAPVLQPSRTASSLPQSVVGEGVGTIQPVSQVGEYSEEYWHPTRRMRGSLTGEAYAAALNRFLNRPTSTAEASQLTLRDSSTHPTLHQIHGFGTSNSNSRNDQPNPIAEATQRASPRGPVTSNTNPKIDQPVAPAESSQAPPTVSPTLPSMHQAHGAASSNSNSSTGTDPPPQTHPMSGAVSSS